MTLLIPKRAAVTVRQEGERVILIQGGRALLDLPWDAALELSRAMHSQAKRAEEIAKVDQVIADEAIMARSGFPLSLTAHPAIRREAEKEALYNTRLRRTMPNRIREDRGQLFPPSVIRHRPKEK